MSGLRKLSRSAHPLAWEQLKAFRKLRRVTQQALRAKDRGDEASMARLGSILARLAPQLFTEGDAGLKEASAQEPDIVQTTLEEGTKEKVAKPTD